MSPGLSAALAAGIQFDTPKEEAKKEEEVPDDVDLRDIDKPRNTIIRLPKFIVEGERPPVFSDKQIYTKKGLADLAVKRYLSKVHQALNQYYLPGFLGGVSSEQLALTMYEEDERLKAMKDYGEKVYLYRQAGDTQNAKELEKDVQSTFMRQSDFAEPPGRTDAGR